MCGFLEMYVSYSTLGICRVSLLIVICHIAKTIIYSR